MTLSRLQLDDMRRRDERKYAITSPPTYDKRSHVRKSAIEKLTENPVGFDSWKDESAGEYWRLCNQGYAVAVWPELIDLTIGDMPVGNADCQVTFVANWAVADD